jgi:hypothetical protein
MDPSGRCSRERFFACMSRFPTETETTTSLNAAPANRGLRRREDPGDAFEAYLAAVLLVFLVPCRA